jgi:hypothetical protein
LAGIPKNWEQSQLNNLCGAYGQIMDSTILTDQKTGVSRGVAFVRLSSFQEAEACIKDLNGKVLEVGTEPVVAKFARDKRSGGNGGGMNQMMGGYNNMRPRYQAAYQQQGYNPYGMQQGYQSFDDQELGKDENALFVFHLPSDVDENTLRDLFQLYGPVTKVTIMKDLQTGRSKGFGFVNMALRMDAENAVQYLNGHALGNKYLKVSWKKNKGGMGGGMNMGGMNMQQRQMGQMSSMGGMSSMGQMSQMGGMGAMGQMSMGQNGMRMGQMGNGMSQQSQYPQQQYSYPQASASANGAQGTQYGQSSQQQVRQYAQASQYGQGSHSHGGQYAARGQSYANNPNQQAGAQNAMSSQPGYTQGGSGYPY